MPGEKGIFTAIDVGTTKVCTIVGEKKRDGGIQVLGYSTVPCQGLKKGNVSDVEATTAAVRESVRQVEAATDHKVASAYVGVTGAHVSFENRRDTLDSPGANGVVTADDLVASPSSLTESIDEPGRKVIHTMRMSYSVDGEDGIRNPLGMHSKDIEVETHVVTGSTAFVEKLVKAVEAGGVRVKSLVLEPLASGLAVMTRDERENGAVLVDIGGGTTDVVIFKNGRIYYSGVIPVGGYQFTNDIAMTFNTNYETAEQVKLEYANIEFYAAGSEEEISLPVEGREDRLNVQRMEISQLTRERALELSQLVKLKIQGADESDDPPARLVLTGGASNLPGLSELMQRTVSMPVRQGLPDMPGDLPHALEDPIYATCVGILLWAGTEGAPIEKQVQKPEMNGTVRGEPKGLVSGFFKKLSSMMPGTIFAPKRGRI